MSNLSRIAFTGALLASTAALPCDYFLGPGGGTYAEDAGSNGLVQPLPPPDAGSDPVPPGEATVRDLKVRLVENGGPGDGASCPDLDSMSFVVDGQDDVTPKDELFLAGYVAPTEAELTAKTTPDIYFRPDFGSDVPGRVTIALGTSEKRQRDGAPFRSSQPYCFSVAWRDRGGNLGERSAPTCVDTVDEKAPYADLVPGQARPFGCSTLPSPASLLLLLPFAAPFVRRRR